MRELKSSPSEELNLAEITLEDTNEFVVKEFDGEDPLISLEFDEESESLTTLMVNTNSSQLYEGTKNILLMYQQRRVNNAFFMINIEAICPNISFVEDKKTPLLNQLTFFANDGLKEFDTS